jgi:hypothetical protein
MLLLATGSLKSKAEQTVDLFWDGLVRFGLAWFVLLKNCFSFWHTNTNNVRFITMSYGCMTISAYYLISYKYNVQPAF